MATDRLLELRSAWNILSILMLSAVVNLITQLPDEAWNASDWSRRPAILVSMLSLLMAGICFQILWELATGCLSAANNSSQKAADLIRGDALEVRLRRLFYLGIGSLATGIVCNFFYRL